LLFVERLAAASGESPWFVAGVSLWPWFTVLFANFAEAMAEGRGKAQADALKAARQNVAAKKMLTDVGTPTARLDFLRRLRDEVKFESSDALRTQIMKDVSRAQKFFRQLKHSSIYRRGLGGINAERHPS
jgi:high-affinity K+ transport system ATPase subunit B